VHQQDTQEEETELVVVRTYSNKLDADLAKMTLQSAGIDSIFHAEGVSEIRSFPLLGEIELLVRADDADDADEILNLDLPNTQS
jgi:hypothetical protein